MRTLLGLVPLLLSLAIHPAFAGALTADPPPTRQLRNPIDLRLTFSLVDPEARDVDWLNPKVIVDGIDFSRTVQPLVAGAFAVPLPGDRTILAERTVMDDRVELRIYGFNAATGPHQVLIELPRKGSAPLRYKAQYLVAP